MELNEDTELNKLLQGVKRTIQENRSFLETLKQETFSEGVNVEEEPADGSDEGAFEEL